MKLCLKQEWTFVGGSKTCHFSATIQSLYFAALEDDVRLMRYA
jgi:hypothetical protein